ncbi:hypothetical protein AURDEDRAFT_164202 [Auricularia subglabra TFB-10046 SS5]|nr:hypothetical protein AURDEDRAFT_164202 [Auricularia subglabra TFB-10046 SS5]
MLTVDAQEVENRREALHALADHAQTLAQRIEAVVGDHELDGEIAHSLEAIFTVLRSIEALFAKQRGKKRLQKAFSYIFTVSAEAEHLRKELTNAGLQFLVATSLDTNVRTREKSRYIGRFRLIRDFEVDRLELITDEHSDDALYKVIYYRARVEGSEPGRVFVLRYLERTDRVESGVSTEDLALCERIRENDRLLEEMSTIRKSHPNVARVYGWSRGDTVQRFTVLKSGYIPITTPHHYPMIEVFNIDAARHVEESGAQWNPGGWYTIFLDDRGTPTIGLAHDIHTLRQDELGAGYYEQIVFLGFLLLGASQPRSPELYPTRFAREGFPDSRFEDCFVVGRMIWSCDLVVQRAPIIRRLQTSTAAYIVKLLAYFDTLEKQSPPVRASGAVLLRAALAAGSQGTTFHATYLTYPHHENINDNISLIRTEVSSNEIRLLDDYTEISSSLTLEVRKKLGIVIPDPLPETTAATLRFSLCQAPGREDASSFVLQYPTVPDVLVHMNM